MQHKTIRLLTLSALALGGCRTLHTDEGKGSRPIAAWSAFSVVDKDGRTVPAPPELIAASLKSVGIAATADGEGLHVAPGDIDRAYKTLLTDERLAGSGIIVFIPVAAGSGHRTPNGIQFVMPTTQPHE